MKRFTSLAVLVADLALLLPNLLSAQMTWTCATPAVPGPGTAPEHAVPSGVVREVALRRAHEVWSQVREGPVIPYVDYEGQTIAYMFHFRVDGQSFPADYGQAVRENTDDVSRFRTATAARQAKREALPAGERTTPPSGRFRYTHILVSARYDRAPILEWGEALSEFYSTAWKMRSEAGEILHAQNPRLSRIVFTWPETWYEFEAAGKSIVMHSHLASRHSSTADFMARMRSSEAETRQRLGAKLAEAGKTLEGNRGELLEQSRQEWGQARKGFPSTDADSAFVPAREQAPFYDWSYGCSPTAAAMVLGWLDAWNWYGRLIDFYFQRRDTAEHDDDWQVADAQQSLSILMGTDSVTGSTNNDNVAPGIEAYCTLKGYSFDCPRTYGYVLNDFAWSAITSAIDNGHAIVWGVSWSLNNGHDMPGWGYRTPQREILVHNTWNPPAEYWHYTDNGQLSFVNVIEVDEGGPVQYDADIASPRGDVGYNHNGGGEVWYAYEYDTLRWASFSHPADSIQVYFSTRGGHPGLWSHIVTIPDTGRVPIFVDPSMATDSARFHIRQIENGLSPDCVSQDGSFGNFSVVVKPAPSSPNPLAPLDGSHVADVRPVLGVQPLNQGFEYQFWLYRDGNLVTFGTSPTNVWQPDFDLENNTVYEWTCQARVRGSTWGETFSPHWTFRTWESPDVPEPSSPPDNATVNSLWPVLVVEPAHLALEYQFRIRHADLSPVAEGPLVAEPNWVPAGLLEEGQTYLWDCRAHNAVGSSQYCAARTLTVSSAPVPVSPADNSIIATKPVLRVQPVPGADYYHFRLYEGTSSVPVQDVAVTEPKLEVTAPLCYLFPYSWDCQTRVGGWGAYFSPRWGFHLKSWLDGGGLPVTTASGGAGITVLDSLHTFFLLPWKNKLDLLKSVADTDQWVTVPVTPIPPGPKRCNVKKGASILDDEEHVYVFKGGNSDQFFRYDPAKDSWAQLPGPGFIKGMKGGFAAYVRLGGQDFIYAGSGSNLSEWKRFAIGTQTWEAAVPASLPVEKAKIGSGLTCDGAGRLYFQPGGQKANGFFVTDLQSDAPMWTTLSALPLNAPGGRSKKVREGGSVEYCRDIVYGVKGGNTKEFWAFQPGGDTWSYVGEVGADASNPPRRGIKCARSLAASRDGLYCLIGNKTNSLFLYTPLPCSLFKAANLGLDSRVSDLEVSGLQSLFSVVPNPATQSLGALISYSLPEPGTVSLKLYDITGKLVRTLAGGYHPAGEYSARLVADGARHGLTRGLYLLEYEAGEYRATEKLIIE